MTIEDLIDLPPIQCNAMTIDELTTYLAPYFPMARAAFTGKRDPTLIQAQLRGAKVAKSVDAKMQQLLNYAARHAQLNP